MAGHSRGCPAYLADLLRFKARYGGSISFMPCLHDWFEEGGSTSNEYFWQDLYVARLIHADAPEKHVDVGSRVDGFVAHVASFREIEVIDVRPITAPVPGIVFKQADVMNLPDSFHNYCDSLSCLHALEHFGLGRYGDPIAPDGHLLGLKNMAKMLKPGGIFYLSAPVGRERVEFNAHCIIDPFKIARYAAEQGLLLKGLAYAEDSNKFVVSEDLEKALLHTGQQKYCLAIFTFEKCRDAES
ncbi:hypothetical protein NK55_03035 [Thermosynechococcus sp. NK55a]|nr:hypothetical protein NK55_03035 [Thermosynechococcus sp. NK55a]